MELNTEDELIQAFLSEDFHSVRMAIQRMESHLARVDHLKKAQKAYPDHSDEQRKVQQQLSDQIKVQAQEALKSKQEIQNKWKHWNNKRILGKILTAYKKRQAEIK